MVFVSPTDDGLKRPPSAAAYQEQVDFWHAAVESRAVENALHGKGRAIFIVNGRSEGDVDAFLRSAPLAHQMNRAIEPLEDFFEHAARIHGYLLENDAVAL